MRINGREATPAEARRAGTIFVLGGAVLAVVFIAAVLVTGALLGPRDDWPTTPGVVVGSVQSVELDRDSDGDTFYRTRHQREVRYEVEGQTYTVATGLRRGDPWPAGEEVVVAYDPADPANAELEGETRTVLWIVGGAGTAFGVLFAGIGLAIRASAGRQRGGAGRPPDYPVTA